jgi:hypothetical protein
MDASALPVPPIVRHFCAKAAAGKIMLHKLYNTTINSTIRLEIIINM